MDDQASTQLIVGGLAVVLGLSGWLLPYKYNLLRLKRFVGRMFSEETNQKVPKIIGTFLFLVGISIIVATLSGTRF